MSTTMKTIERMGGYHVWRIDENGHKYPGLSFATREQQEVYEAWRDKERARSIKARKAQRAARKRNRGGQ